MKKAAQAIPNQQLRQERERRCWTQLEVADRIGTTAPNISRWERGITFPTPHFRQELCALFGKSAAELGLLQDETTNDHEGQILLSPPIRQVVERHLPVGTVTLLFTDIEDSTQLLQLLGEHYAQLLREYRELLKRVFEEYHGHEVDTQGDACFVAFGRATDAVAAAVIVQQVLSAHSWPQGEAVRVRMGLHTGEPERASTGYVGLDAHRAAHIMSAGHGGQVLLSQTTRDLVEHDLPDGVSLRDLGAYRLKDLHHPSHLFQLIIGGLPAEFPPLKTLESRPHNLPIQATLLIGREKEVAAVEHLLHREDIRLLTLTGPGGIGKTRLALQVLAELSDQFADGVFLVPLAPLRDPELVLPAILQTLSISDLASRPPLKVLQSALKDKQLLLLLDNFEQVIAAALQVAELLTACPSLKLLVTSRVVLHVQSEHQFAVPPLSLPNPKRLPDLVTLVQYEAVALFVSRAQAVKPDFALTPATAPAVAGICARLDGMPLAIELAAARAKYFPPRALLSRLEQNLAVLVGGARDLPARQQTLRNTLAWSYDLLAPEEQALFRRLAVFVDGCTVEAAEAVCPAAGELAGEVLEGVLSLVDKSMLRLEEQAQGDSRCWMLQLLREFGLEMLSSAGEAGVTRQAHAAYYLRLSEEAEPQLRGAEQAHWYGQLEREQENLRAALTFLLERTSRQSDAQAGQMQAEQALRLYAALSWFWYIHGYAREGLAFMEQVLALRSEVGATLRIRALLAAGELAWSQQDKILIERAEVLFGECLQLCRERSDTVAVAECLYRLGLVARERTQLKLTRARIEEAAELFMKVNDRWSQGLCSTELARLAMMQGQYERALVLLDESLALYQALSDRQRIGWVECLQAHTLFVSQQDVPRAELLAEQSLAHLQEVGAVRHKTYPMFLLGEMRLQEGELVQARSLFEESLVLLQQDGMPGDAQEPLLGLARVAVAQGDRAAARHCYQECLMLMQEFDIYLKFVPDCLEGLGALLAAQANGGASLAGVREAARLWGAAEALREALGTPMHPVSCAAYEQAVAAARLELGEEAFAAAWEEGRATPVAQVIDEELKREV